MKTLVKLALFSALVWTLVPYSFANEWVPQDIIRMLETEYLLNAAGGSPDSSVRTNLSKIMRADIPTTMTNGKQRAISSVQYSSPAESWPFDVIRTWVMPLDP